MIKQFVTIIITILIVSTTDAQANLSAVIDIRYEGVELKRANSDLWLPLPQSAIAFIGAGDTLRTDATGRVDIQFGESAHLLLLSNSDFTLNTFNTSGDILTLDSVVNGNAVMETDESMTFGNFAMQLNDLTINSPANLMSIWSFPDVTDTVTVAKGTATILANDTLITIPEESGFLAEQDRTDAITFEPEWHAAKLEAGLYGCEGEIQTAGNVALLVRTGPGQGFQTMGTLDVSRIVSIMGITETTSWTRIQYLTGFGWTRSQAVRSDCTDLPILPDDSPQEKFITIVNVTDEEIAILEPFLQTPATNAFTYQFVRN